MLEKLLRYARQLEKLEAHKLSSQEYANFLVLESELTPNDFVLLDKLQWCQRRKQLVWTKDIWPKSMTANYRRCNIRIKIRFLKTDGTGRKIDVSEQFTLSQLRPS